MFGKSCVVGVLAILAAGCAQQSIAESGLGAGTTDAKSESELWSHAPIGYGLVERQIIDVDPHKNQKVYLRKVYGLAAVDTIENSTNVTAVTRMSDYQGAYQADLPRVSPNGKKILFQLLESDSINLWTMDSGTGLNKVRNTDGSHLNFFPSYSTNGEKILFSSNRTDPNAHLWEIKAQGGGGGLRRLTDSLETDMWVHEDPAGKGTLAYTRFQVGSRRGTIWTYDRTSYLSTQLREGQESQISPDGAKIVFSKFDDREAHFNIWVMNIDGTHPTQLTHNDADNITPSWHPSGNWITFASNKGTVSSKSRVTGQEIVFHNFDIWVMKTNGEHVSQLTENGSDDDSPVFTPDGKTFYFTSNRGHALENVPVEGMDKLRARGYTLIVGRQRTELPVGHGRDIWRATVTEEILREDISSGKSKP